MGGRAVAAREGLHGLPGECGGQSCGCSPKGLECGEAVERDTAAFEAAKHDLAH